MDFSNKKFRKLLNQSYEMIEDWYSNNLRGEKIYNNTTPNEIKKAVSYTHLTLPTKA